jgi:hypothetical protein
MHPWITNTCYAIALACNTSTIALGLRVALDPFFRPRHGS